MYLSVVYNILDSNLHRKELNTGLKLELFNTLLSLQPEKNWLLRGSNRIPNTKYLVYLI